MSDVNGVGRYMTHRLQADMNESGRWLTRVATYLTSAMAGEGATRAARVRRSCISKVPASLAPSSD